MPDQPHNVPDGFAATYVGRLGAHRGLETVVDALSALDGTDDAGRVDETDGTDGTDGLDDRPRVNLLIVGPDDSSNADALRARAADLGIDDRLSFTGWVDFEDVPQYMAASDVCVVTHEATPHTETTVPHKLFQYMAAARPVLVSDVAPFERIVTDAAAGLVVPAGDHRAAADALSELAADPELATALGANGRRAVEATYRWETDAKRLRGLYRDLEAVPADDCPSRPVGRSVGRSSAAAFDGSDDAPERQVPS